MANKKDKSTKNKEEEKKTLTKQDGKILNNAYDTYVSGTTSKERIEEVMGKITITSCDAIVSPPSNYGGGFSSAANCSGSFDPNKASSDMALNTGVSWAASHCDEKSCADDRLWNNGITIKKWHQYRYLSGKSYGKCTSSVVGHLVTGGYNWKFSQCGNGYHQYELLEQSGDFDQLQIPLNECNTNNKIRVLENKKMFITGDICEMSHGGSLNGSSHAAMWDGRQNKWVSDFVQNWCLVYDGGNRNRQYALVKFYRLKQCKPGESSQEGGASQMPSVQQGKKLELKVIRKCLTDKWSYGQFYINGTYYCDVIECGKQGSSCPKSKNYTATISPTTYTISLEHSPGFTDHAKRPDSYEHSPEFGEFLKKDILYNNICLMPTVGGKSIGDVSNKKSNHSGILIHGGRGSWNSIGCLVLGRKLNQEYVKSKVKEDTLYFAKPASTKSENMKIYQKDWDIYVQFYKKLTDVVGGKGRKGQVATLEIKHDFWK